MYVVHKRLVGFTLIAISFCTALAVVGASSSALSSDTEGRHEYVLEVAGSGQVVLEMLLVTKSQKRSGPTREAARVMSPYKKTFKAVGCYAWFDTLPDGNSGKNGDTFTITLQKDGTPSAEVQGKLEAANKQTGALGDL